MNSIKIRKMGTFYTVFDDDCYILYFFFGYQIKKNKVGFPKSALGKVINLLDENKINYEVIDDSNNNANFKKLNRYSKFVKLGKDRYISDNYCTEILEKMHKANKSQISEILSTIEEILNE